MFFWALNTSLDSAKYMFCLHIQREMVTAQKKYLIKDFLSECDQIRRKLWIWSHLLKKCLTEITSFFVHLGTGTFEL